jgi:hypothetical protein
MSFALIGWLLLSACNPVSLEQYELCDLSFAPQPEHADPGETITLVGGPLSADFDIVVSFDGAPGDVTGIDREGCDECDTCKLANDCLACGTCLACDALCTSCVETTEVVVPDLPDGPVTLSMINNFGSGQAPFRIGPPPDPAPTGDTGEAPSTADTGATPPTGDTAAPSPTGDTAGQTADTAAGPTGDTAASTGHTGAVSTPTAQTGDTATP